jgi:hypothetical protein
MKTNDLKISVDAYVLALCNAGLWALLAVRWVPAAPRYTDFIAGPTVWTGAMKQRDFLALAIFCVLFLVFYRHGSPWIKRLKASASNSAFSALRYLTYLVVATVVVKWAAWTKAGQAVGISDAILLTALSIQGWFLVGRRNLTESEVYATLGQGLLFLFLLPYGLAGVVLTLSALSIPVEAHSQTVTGMLFGVQAMALLWIIWVWKNVSFVRVGETFSKAIFALQFLLALLFFSLFPSMVRVGETYQRIPVGVALFTFCTLLVAGAWLHMWFGANRGWKQRGPLPPWNLSASAIAAIACYHHVDRQVLPAISFDLMYFGELLLPYYQWARHGLIPYVGFIPIHGLTELAIGALTDVFFLGNALSLAYAMQIFSAVFAAVTSIILCGVAGNAVGMFVAVCCFPLMNQFVAVPLILLVLVHPLLISKPLFWLSTWAVGSVFGLLLNVPMGLALACGFFLPAVHQLQSTYRSSPRLLGAWFVFVFGVVLLFFLHPLLRMGVEGFWNYAYQSSLTNGIAHGIPYEFSTELSADAQHGMLLEIFRMAWIPFACFCAVVAVAEWRRGVASRNQTLLYLAVAVPIISLVASPWTLNRVDVGHLSRPGYFSIWMLLYIAPVLVWLLTREKQVLLRVAPLYLLVMGISPQPYLPSKTLSQVAVAPVAPEKLHWVERDSLQLPMVGSGLLSHATQSGLTELRKILDSVLSAGETFFDLSNNSGFYILMDRRVPGRYVSNYVTASTSLQRQVLEKLRQERPPLVLIHPAITYDSGPASLRSYLLYREFIGDYVPWTRSGFTFLVDPNRVPRVERSLSSVELAKLDSVFRQSDLGALPRTWGRNWEHGRAGFEKVGPLLASEGTSGTATVELPPAGRPSFSGQDADYLLLDIRLSIDSLHSAGAPSLKMNWTAGGKQSTPIEFELQQGLHLVPIGAFPSWLLEPSIESLSFAPRTHATRLESVSVTLLRRVDGK